MFCGIRTGTNERHTVKAAVDLLTRALRRGFLTLARAERHRARSRYVQHNMNRMFRGDYGPEIERIV
jgi:succinylglutamate desuccinylase